MVISLTIFGPSKINVSSWFHFSSKIVFCYFHISIPHLPCWTVTKWTSYSCLCEKMFWFHPITTVVKILSLYCWIYISDMKIIPMTKEMHKYLFCKNKGYCCSGSSPKRTFMRIFQMDQKLFCHVNILGHEVYFPSHMFLLSHKTRCYLHLY